MKNLFQQTIVLIGVLIVATVISLGLFSLLGNGNLQPFWKVNPESNLPLFLLIFVFGLGISLFTLLIVKKNLFLSVRVENFHFFDPQRFPQKRIHLRYSFRSNSNLLINAQKVIYLNESAAYMALLFLKNFSQEEAVQRLKRRFRQSDEILLNDYREFSAKLEAFIQRDDICPITFLDIEKIEPFSAPINVPFRMDLVLTYNCNNDCQHCYNIKKRELKELSTEQWKATILKLAEIGVPHIAFTGGEPTLRSDLAELICYAENSGIICGLLTNGVKLSDLAYLETLKRAGLDYVQITINSFRKDTHNLIAGANTFQQTVAAINNCIQEKIYLITNTTINRLNRDDIKEMVDFLHSLGVKTFAMNSIINSGRARSANHDLSSEELIPLLKIIRDRAKEKEMKFIWYSPTRYCELNPMELDIGIKSCTAGKYNFAIEPDGTVIPCQSLYHPVGNIIKDSWKKIYSHKFLNKLRNRDWKLSKCADCNLLQYCGCGCPLQIENDSFCCPDLLSNPG